MGTAVNSNAHTANSQNYIDVGHWIVTTSEELCAKYKLIGYICKIVKPSDPNYETPTVITGIRGTALLLDIAPDSTTTITALEGDQDIFIRDTGESLVLRAGEIITIPPTTNLHWPIEYNPSLTNIAPSCRVSGAGITPEGKTFVNLVVQDDSNGLNAIGVQDIVNAEVVVEGQQLQRGDAISLNQLIFTPVTITIIK